MQRSSLGSPGSKLHGHGGEKEEKVDGEERRKKEGCGVDRCGVADEDENKEEKLHRSMSYRSERSIHLIPILIIFCILVLYLCSYDPSQKELAHFNGFRWFSKPTGIIFDGDRRFRAIFRDRERRCIGDTKPSELAGGRKRRSAILASSKSRRFLARIICPSSIGGVVRV
ncbi:PREDICTED: uncharacterized protein LOC104611473 isoform X2 [Nelumbo nucifera]|uniref:Uncharacterized protein LOC104611473 isoform X2 n=1 Tax=Nelumbo nucifera TaxID=4432 RepID=A0A1U8BJ99_NELNU|nr:PREDICTED: uncharacterized protein LOC104611473 isoform X2 [Nelumbo nucifera]